MKNILDFFSESPFSCIIVCVMISDVVRFISLAIIECVKIIFGG